MIEEVKKYSIKDVLIDSGIIDESAINEIEKFQSETGWSFVKVCLTFGYVSRKNGVRLLNRLDIRWLMLRRKKLTRRLSLI